MKGRSVALAAALAAVCSPAWGQWQYVEGFEEVEARVTAQGYTLAVVCWYDDWDDMTFEEIRLVPPDTGRKIDVERLKERAPTLTIEADDWESSTEAHPFDEGGSLYFWADVASPFYKRLAAASGWIRATITLSSPSETFADQSFSARGSSAAIRAYEKGCNDLW